MNNELANQLFSELVRRSMHPVQRAVLEVAEATVKLNRSQNNFEFISNSQNLNEANQRVIRENVYYQIPQYQLDLWFTLFFKALTQ